MHTLTYGLQKIPIWTHQTANNENAGMNYLKNTFLSAQMSLFKKIIIGLCLMKLPSEMLQKFAIFFF